MLITAIVYVWTGDPLPYILAALRLEGEGCWCDSLEKWTSEWRFDDLLLMWNREIPRLTVTFCPTDPPAGKEPGCGVGVHTASHRKETWLQLGRGALGLLRSLCRRWGCETTDEMLCSHLLLSPTSPWQLFTLNLWIRYKHISHLLSITHIMD